MARRARAGGTPVLLALLVAKLVALLVAKLVALWLPGRRVVERSTTT